MSLAVCAMLCGARSLYAIAQWGRDHGVAAGQLLGFRQGKTPCAATLHRVFKDLEVDAFEAVLRERGATLTVWVDACPKQRHGRLERAGTVWALADPELNGYTGSAGTVGEVWPHLQ